MRSYGWLYVAMGGYVWLYLSMGSYGGYVWQCVTTCQAFSGYSHYGLEPFLQFRPCFLDLRRHHKISTSTMHCNPSANTAWSAGVLLSRREQQVARLGWRILTSLILIILTPVQPNSFHGCFKQSYTSYPVSYDD